MKLKFLGTGAADWDWNNFPPGTRGPCSTLVGGSCLIDLGWNALHNFTAAGVSPEVVSDIVITHAHGDHFSPDEILKLAAAAGHPVRLWASANALADVDSPLVDKHVVAPRSVFTIGSLEFTAMPANHFSRIGDTPFHYLVREGDVRLLYATDGVWIDAEEKYILEEALRSAGALLDAVIWDSTLGPAKSDYRFASHNSLNVVRQLKHLFARNGYTRRGARHFLDHLSRELWPKDPDGRARLAARLGATLVEDGMEAEVRCAKRGR